MEGNVIPTQTGNINHYYQYNNSKNKQKAKNTPINKTKKKYSNIYIYIQRTNISMDLQKVLSFLKNSS